MSKLDSENCPPNSLNSHKRNGGANEGENDIYTSNESTHVSKVSGRKKRILRSNSKLLMEEKDFVELSEKENLPVPQNKQSISNSKKRALPDSIETTPTITGGTKKFKANNAAATNSDPLISANLMFFKPINFENQEDNSYEEKSKLNSPLCSPLKKLVQSLPHAEGVRPPTKIFSLDETCTNYAENTRNNSQCYHKSINSCESSKSSSSVASCSPDESPAIFGKNFTRDESENSLQLYEWPNIGAEDGLCYEKSLKKAEDGVQQACLTKSKTASTFMSPQFNFSKSLVCNENFGPLNNASKAGEDKDKTKIKPGSQFDLAKLEPLQQSPFILTSKCNEGLVRHTNSSFFPFDSALPYNQNNTRDDLSVANTESPFDNDLNDPNLVDGEFFKNNEFDIDISQYFTIKSGKDEDGNNVKWLEFNMAMRPTPKESPEGSIFQSQGPCKIVIPRSPWPENLPKLSDELGEEIKLRNDLWSAWREVEETYLPCPTYFVYQDLDKAMRSILINWMMEISCDMKLHRQTFELALNYVDRFFSRTKNLPKDLFQVVAAAVIFIAAKKEEIEPPSIAEILHISATPGLTAPQLNAVEISIVKVLKWKLTPPTYVDWLSLYLRKSSMCYPEKFPPPLNYSNIKGDYPPEPFSFRPDIFKEALFIIDVFVHMAESLEFTPSVVSGSAFYLACESRIKILSEEDMTDLIEVCTGYAYTDLIKCINLLRETIIARRQHFPIGKHNDEFHKCAPELECFQPSLNGLPEILRDFSQNSTLDIVDEDGDFGLSNVIWGEGRSENVISPPIGG